MIHNKIACKHITTIQITKNKNHHNVRSFNFYPYRKSKEWHTQWWFVWYLKWLFAIIIIIIFIIIGGRHRTASSSSIVANSILLFRLVWRSIKSNNQICTQWLSLFYNNNLYTLRKLSSNQAIWFTKHFDTMRVCELDFQKQQKVWSVHVIPNAKSKMLAN